MNLTLKRSFAFVKGLFTYYAGQEDGGRANDKIKKTTGPWVQRLEGMKEPKTNVDEGKEIVQKTWVT